MKKSHLFTTLLMWVVTILVISAVSVAIANNASTVVKVDNDVVGESYTIFPHLDDAMKALELGGSTDTDTGGIMKHPLLTGTEDQLPLLSRDRIYVVVPVLLRGGDNAPLIKSKGKEQCKSWDVTMQPGTDLLGVDESVRKTLSQHGAYNHHVPPNTHQVNDLLSFNSRGMVEALDNEYMLTHHREDVFGSGNDNGYLNEERFLVCATSQTHSGVYLARLMNGIYKVGRMAEMCKGAMERDGYDPTHTHVVFDLDRCGSKCLDGINDHIIKVKKQVPSLDYKAVTTVEFLQFEKNNGGITPHLGLFLHLSLDKGGIDKAGVERAVVLSLAESSVQTLWEGDVGPDIDSSRSVHEWIHYPAAVSIISERRGNAINFWNNKMSKILSEDGLLYHPLTHTKVTVHRASVSWKPPRQNINQVNLVNIKKEVREIVADSAEVEELVFDLESKFGIDMSEVDVDDVALTDTNRWFDVVKQKLKGDLESNSKQSVVAATEVVYDRLLKKDGSHAKGDWFDPIEISNVADWGYNTNLMKCSERESGRANIEHNLKQAKVTVGDPENAEYSLVVVPTDKCSESFRSTSDCTIRDTIEAMMKRQGYEYLTRYNQVDHYYHRNADCQTTLALVHNPLSKALKSRPIWESGFSEDEKDDHLDKADTADYMQGFLQIVQDPSKKFLSDQLASESMVVANTFLRYLDDQWHLTPVIATKFAKELLLLNNESINSLDPEYGNNAGPVTKLVRGEEKNDYNVGWRVANALSRRIVRKAVGGFRDEDKNMKHFVKEALEILSEKDRDNTNISNRIQNMKELKQDIIGAIQEAHKKSIRKKTRKRGVENTRVSNEKMERMNRARTT